MRFQFDVRLLLKKNKTGIAWSAQNILLNLCPRKEDKYELNFFRDKDISSYKEILYALRRKGFSFNDSAKISPKLYKVISSLVYLPYSCFFGGNADVTLFFDYIIPPGVKGKKIIYVHDMAYKSCPQTVRWRTQMLLNKGLKTSCKQADHIITISEFSKSEIIKYLGIKADKITVIPMGVSPDWFLPISDENIRDVKKKYQLPAKYILYLGTLEPRKNIKKLIEAYHKVLMEETACPKLVLAGGKGWMYDEIFSAVKSLKIKEKVIFTGYVDEMDKQAIMTGADIFVFPSVYEGFGIPPLEAMACRVPVITSKGSSLPEVVGDAALLADPYSTEDIANKIKQLLFDADLKEELRGKGVERAQKFSWINTANQLTAILDKYRNKL